jgi:hypothetical protein
MLAEEPHHVRIEVAAERLAKSGATPISTKPV